VPAALRCESLEKRYGSVEALGGVDLEVAPGELLGLLGPNGAGKSTLTKIACGLVRASGGRADVEGAPAGSAEARAAIGYLAELFRFPDWLTADELLALHQELAGSGRGAPERTQLLEQIGLADAKRTKIGAMSKGCSSGSASPRRSWARRGSSCSTSPPARSTPSAGAWSATCCATCAAAA
jgi:ABC-2 type transport system ATP-binding protein